MAAGARYVTRARRTGRPATSTLSGASSCCVEARGLGCSNLPGLDARGRVSWTGHGPSTPQGSCPKSWVTATASWSSAGWARRLPSTGSLWTATGLGLSPKLGVWASGPGISGRGGPRRVPDAALGDGALQ